MAAASETLLAPRLVTFRYRSEIESAGTPKFGLIAEEVTEVNPDLVVRDAKGELTTVRYEAVNAMLLNEFLKEQRKVEEQERKMSEQSRKAQEQEATIAELKASVGQQQKGIEVLTAQLKEQAAQIQKVSARFEAGNSASQAGSQSEGFLQTADPSHKMGNSPSKLTNAFEVDSPLPKNQGRP